MIFWAADDSHALPSYMLQGRWQHRASHIMHALVWRTEHQLLQCSGLSSTKTLAEQYISYCSSESLVILRHLPGLTCKEWRSLAAEYSTPTLPSASPFCKLKSVTCMHTKSLLSSRDSFTELRGATQLSAEVFDWAWNDSLKGIFHEKH